jgi:hypothetical protein
MKFLFTIALMILVHWGHPGFGAEPPNELTQEELYEWINNLDPATRVCDFSKFASYNGFRNCTLVTNKMLASLGKQCPTLEAIDLTCCNSITYEGVESLADLCYPHLQELKLSSSTRQHPQGSAIQSFGEILRHCPNLKILNFNDLYLSDESLKLISTFCPGLESVAFFAISPDNANSFHLQFTEQGLCDLVSSLPNLKQFSVSSNHMNQVSNRVLEIVAANCPSLSQLCVGSKEDLNYGIQLIVKSCPELTNIPYRNFSGETLRVIGQYSQKFEYLTLVKSHDNTHDVTNDDAVSFALGCPNLKAFSAKFYTAHVDLSDSFLQALSSNCHQLISLTIENPLYDISSAITEKGLMHLVQGCPRIQTLNLSGSGGGITDKSLGVLSGCKQLKFLNIKGSRVTADGVDKLLNDLPELSCLDITLCKKINWQQVGALEKKYPHVIIKREC